jgi:hypothetical protein
MGGRKVSSIQQPSPTQKHAKIMGNPQQIRQGKWNLFYRKSITQRLLCPSIYGQKGVIHLGREDHSEHKKHIIKGEKIQKSYGNGKPLITQSKGRNGRNWLSLVGCCVNLPYRILKKRRKKRKGEEYTSKNTLEAIFIYFRQSFHFIRYKSGLNLPFWA